MGIKDLLRQPIASIFRDKDPFTAVPSSINAKDAEQEIAEAKVAQTAGENEFPTSSTTTAKKSKWGVKIG